ncbi:unnamed protein product [Closterium sp. Naga37s-1]|nr:unnamed protein product [Closterium sp. Naga37s-1]
MPVVTDKDIMQQAMVEFVVATDEAFTVVKHSTIKFQRLMIAANPACAEDRVIPSCTTLARQVICLADLDRNKLKQELVAEGSGAIALTHDIWTDHEGVHEAALGKLQEYYSNSKDELWGGHVPRPELQDRLLPDGKGGVGGGGELLIGCTNSRVVLEHPNGLPPVLPLPLEPPPPDAPPLPESLPDPPLARVHDDNPDRWAANLNTYNKLRDTYTIQRVVHRAAEKAHTDATMRILSYAQDEKDYADELRKLHKHPHPLPPLPQPPHEISMTLPSLPPHCPSPSLPTPPSLNPPPPPLPSQPLPPPPSLLRPPPPPLPPSRPLLPSPPVLLPPHILTAAALLSPCLSWQFSAAEQHCS